MKIIMFEATAEELSANKRIMDSIIDALSNIADAIIRGDIPVNIAELNDDEQVEVDDEADSD